MNIRGQVEIIAEDAYPIKKTKKDKMVKVYNKEHMVCNCRFTANRPWLLSLSVCRHYCSEESTFYDRFSIPITSLIEKI